MKTRPSGFTLVEVLVVLVITALVSTLLFQALAQVYRLQGRFGEQLAQSQGGAMRADWYRQVLQGLLNDYADGKQRFAGQVQRLEGLSATALTVAGGAPQWVVMEIRSEADGSELLYQAGSQQVTMLRWQGGGEFAYLDEAGAEHAQWPPMGSGAAWSQLPVAVLLKWPTPQGRAVLVAAPRGDREAKIRPLGLGGPS
jgi:general secretion pathway protein J